MRAWTFIAAIAVAFTVLPACGSSGSSNTTTQASPIPPTTAYTLNAAGAIEVVSTANVDAATRVIVVEGLEPGEYLVDIDEQPGTGDLVALGQLGGIYTIDASTGTATHIATSSAALVGTDHDIAFDPITGHLRVVSATAATLDIDVNSGSAVREPDLFFVAGDVNSGSAVSIAALALVASGGSLQHYMVDATNDALLRASATVSGGVETIGSLGIDVNDDTSLDSTADGTIYLVARTANRSRLYVLDKATGATSFVSETAKYVRGIALDAVPPAPEVTIYGVTAGNVLVSFKSDTPATIDQSTSITGMAAGEVVVAMDYRPATHQLVVLADSGAIYILDTATGSASALSASASLSGGVQYGSDFDAQADRLRLVNAAGGNVALDVTTGVSTSDGAIVYAGSDVNSGASAAIEALASTATTTYGIDGGLDVLVRFAAPATGIIETVGPLGVTVAGAAAFDVEASAGAFLTLEGMGESELYQVDLQSGGATSLGIVAAGDVLTVIAVKPMPLDEMPAYVLNQAGEIITLVSTRPMDAAAGVAVTGLAAGEALVGLAVNPNTGRLVGLTDAGQIVEIDPISGATASLGSTTEALVGAAFGIDVDPLTGRLTIVSDTDQSLSSEVTGSATIVLAALAYASGDANELVDASVEAIAYTNSIAGATATVAYGIDTTADTLVVIDPANGEVSTVGSLGFDAEAVADLDIRAGTGRAYAAVSKVGETVTRLYTIELATGVASEVGVVASGTSVTSFALSN